MALQLPQIEYYNLVRIRQVSLQLSLMYISMPVTMSELYSNPAFRCENPTILSVFPNGMLPNEMSFGIKKRLTSTTPVSYTHLTLPTILRV